jgi:hypothetical protein
MLVELILAKIGYQGDSIGDDIRVEIDCLNHSLDFNKTLKNRSEVTVNKPVGAFFTDQLPLSLPLSVRVIERDLIFNDFGTAEKTFAVNTQNAEPQRLAVSVAVPETRNYRSKKKATFDLTFEAQVSKAIRYLGFTKQGWFSGKYTTTKKPVGLISYLQVSVERLSVLRDYFRIMEGPYRGQRVSLAREHDVSYLESENPHREPVHLHYSLSQKTIILENKRYAVRSYPDDPDPWKKGTRYTIEIADYPHDLGRSYLDRADLALVWFKVNHPDGTRYLHVGAVSLGCLTLTEIERWDELCKVLLRARRSDGRNIGIVEIVD